MALGIYYNETNWTDGVVANHNEASSYLFANVLEKVLCDGWDSKTLSAYEASNNKLTITTADTADLRQLTTITVSTPAAIAGDYRVTKIEGNKVTMRPAHDGTVADVAHTADNGTFVRTSAGWTKLYRSATEMVVRPKNEVARCFLIRFNNDYYVGNINNPYELIEMNGNVLRSQIRRGNQQMFGQIIPLKGWESALSVEDNVNKYKWNTYLDNSKHAQVYLDYSGNDSTHTMPACLMRLWHNTATRNHWFLYATDEFVYWAPMLNMWSAVDYSQYQLSSFGLAQMYNGQKVSYVSGNPALIFSLHSQISNSHYVVINDSHSYCSRMGTGAMTMNEYNGQNSVYYASAFIELPDSRALYVAPRGSIPAGKVANYQQLTNILIGNINATFNYTNAYIMFPIVIRDVDILVNNNNNNDDFVQVNHVLPIAKFPNMKQLIGDLQRNREGDTVFYTVVGGKLYVGLYSWSAQTGCYCRMDFEL